MSATLHTPVGLPLRRRTSGSGRSVVTMARWVTVAVLSAASLPGLCQTLADPTRPPAAWLASKSGAALPEVESGPRLQSLILGGTQKYAIIDGQLVGVGDTLKDGRVVAVRATEVVVRTEQGNQTLKLFPDVEKHVAKPAEAGAKSRSRMDAQSGRKIVIKETK